MFSTNDLLNCAGAMYQASCVKSGPAHMDDYLSSDLESKVSGLPDNGQKFDVTVAAFCNNHKELLKTFYECEPVSNEIDEVRGKLLYEIERWDGLAEYLS